MTNSPLRLAGVCGWPIHHSLSPLMHTYWLKHMNIQGAYVHFAVRPDEAVRAFKSLKKTSITGVNVTLPLKHLAYEAADVRTLQAEKLGVANCLYKVDGKLIAHNTDQEGFMFPLFRHFGQASVRNTAALIVGTGGASRSVIGSLIDMNCPEIRVCGRNPEKTQALVQSFDVPSVYPIDWNERHATLRTTGLLINASSGGMSGKGELDLNLDYAGPGTFIYDLVYTPLQTGLIQQAIRHGLPHIGGLEMLVAQARPSFEKFFGAVPPEAMDPIPLLQKALEG